MQWFSNGVLYDSSHTEDQQRFIGGNLLDGPGPLGTELEPPTADIEQTAPFAEQSLYVHGPPVPGVCGIRIGTTVTVDIIRTAITTAYSEIDIEFTAQGESSSGAAETADIVQTAPFAQAEITAETATRATEANIDQAAPFATQDVSVNKEGLLTDECPPEWMSGGLLWNTGQLITTFAGGTCLDGCTQQTTVNEAQIDQTAPFSTEYAYLHHYLGVSIDQTAPFAETRSSLTETGTTADIVQTAPSAVSRSVASSGVTGGGEGGCGRGPFRRRRCCCCGSGGTGRVFPFVESLSHGYTNANQLVHTITLPTGIEDGDLLLLLVASGSRNTPLPTIDQAVNWNLLATQHQASIMRVSYWYSWAIGGEGQLVLTFSEQSSMSYACYRISGADVTRTPVISGFVYQHSTAPNPPILNPWGGVSNRTLWVAGMGWDNNFSCTGHPATYDNIAEDYWASTSGEGVSMVSKRMNTAVDDPGPFTLSGTTYSLSSTLAIMGALT